MSIVKYIWKEIKPTTTSWIIGIFLIILCISLMSILIGMFIYLTISIVFPELVTFGFYWFKFWFLGIMTLIIS